MCEASHYNSVCFYKIIIKSLGIKYFGTGYSLENMDGLSLPRSHSLFLKQWGNTFTELANSRECM